VSQGKTRRCKGKIVVPISTKRGGGEQGRWEERPEGIDGRRHEGMRGPGRKSLSGVEDLTDINRIGGEKGGFKKKKKRSCAR